ncbi:MAG: 4-hydroxy-tetrahydrodipicolinate reductase [Spirochaetaceae bacterium]|nr:MAG: 4-hydroxy-tetrahydrodipicolinate reductase [Spirochaetaceae bacterium]
MNIALVGYGQMGRMVHDIALGRGHSVVTVVDPTIVDPTTVDPATDAAAAAGGPVYARALAPELLTGVDVAIEFSLAAAVVDNVRVYAAAGVAAVIGTTGWTDRVDAVASTVADAGVGLVYGSNFSIGAHVFFRVAASAARLVADLDEYDATIHEIHHRRKKDSPSGTALTLAEHVLRALPAKTTIETGRLDRAPHAHELHVSSTRGGANPGCHTLYLDSEADTIEVRHQARSRIGFASGAVRAAEWIAGRTGLYTVDDFVNDTLDPEHRGTQC